MATKTESAASETGDTTDQIARLRAQVEALLNERVTPAVADAAGRAESAVHDATAALREQAEAVSGKVREQPLLAILIAGGRRLRARPRDTLNDADPPPGAHRGGGGRAAPARAAGRAMVRAAFGRRRIGFLLAAWRALHIAAWFWLRRTGRSRRRPGDGGRRHLPSAVLLMVLAARSSPGRVELEALAVRRACLDSATGSLGAHDTGVAVATPAGGSRVPQAGVASRIRSQIPVSSSSRSCSSPRKSPRDTMPMTTPSCTTGTWRKPPSRISRSASIAVWPRRQMVRVASSSPAEVRRRRVLALGEHAHGVTAGEDADQLTLRDWSPARRRSCAHAYVCTLPAPSRSAAASAASGCGSISAISQFIVRPPASYG